MTPLVYHWLATVVLALHGLWIVWVIFGASITRGRRLLAGFHLASLAWGLIVEVFPLPCPFTEVEQQWMAKAGHAPYAGDFLAHYLELLIYPDLPYWTFPLGALVVVAANALVYLRRWRAGARHS